PYGLARVALDVLALDRLALVVRLLAAGEPDLDLDLPVLEVGLQGHDRVALLRRLAPELPDLAAMEQQLAVAALRMVLDVAVTVGADAAAHEPELALPLLHEGVAEV